MVETGAQPSSAGPIDHVIYGKVIVDDIHLADGRLARGLLGGGGPQAACGARLWSDGVGLVTRTGADLAPAQETALRTLDVDLQGRRSFSGIPTPRTLIRYDGEEYLTGGLTSGLEDWTRLLDQRVSLPPAYRQPRAIHLITEFPDEPMVADALDVRRRGAIVSLEPLLMSMEPEDWDRMLALVRHVDLVTPDWPAASAVAGSDDPPRVLEAWSRLGPDAVAIRHGARGAYVWGSPRDEAWHIPAVPVKVVDPTGAGNAFGGGLCVGWTDTRDILIAGGRAAVAAAILIRQVGLPAMSPALRADAAALMGPALASAQPM
jgi:sugar/nucleoside kinase (ribokinase family)